MKLLHKRQLELHKLASKDHATKALTAVHFNGDNTATVTDGHKLVQVHVKNPLPVDDFPARTKHKQLIEKEHLIPADGCKTALSFIDKKAAMPIIRDYVLIAQNKQKNRIDLQGDFSKQQTISLLDNRFPNYKAVITNQDNRKKTAVGMDPVYLKEICEFIIKGQKDQRQKNIVIEFCNNKTTEFPITIKAETDNGDCDIKAIVMPLRI